MTHVLACTVGASPQVVTETLFAVHREGWRWPDRLVLLTTAYGARRARDGLVGEGNLARLCRELEVDQPKFEPEDMLVIPAASGEPVDDARTVSDHEAVGDFITASIRRLTSDDAPDASTTLHASLAGGRKTMTFYLGYAMSLFGRRDDVLSHVLVTEGFEGRPEFWFPSRTQSKIRTRDGSEIDPASAEVTLASIPFIRHRSQLPGDARLPAGAFSFRDLVALINLSLRPEQLRVTVDISRLCIRIWSVREKIVPIEIFPKDFEFAFYSLVARAMQGGGEGLDPPRRDPDEGHMRNLIVGEVLRGAGISFAGDGDSDLELLRESDRIDERSLDAVASGVDRAWCDNRRSRLRVAFEAKLPPALVELVLPGIGVRTGKESQSGSRRVKGGRYVLGLAPEQLEIVENDPRS